MNITIHKALGRPVLADSGVVYSQQLSFGAKGLMCIIENEKIDWAVEPEEIYKAFPKNSIEEIEGYIRELMDFGYLGEGMVNVYP